MPAALLVVATLAGLVPKFLADRGKRYLGGFRVFAVIIIIVDIVISVHYSYANYGKKDFRIGHGGDSFFTYGATIAPEGSAVARLLEYLDAAVPPGASLAVLPEGVMINYLARRVNTTPHINFMPPEMLIFGEANILDSFKMHPPDYVILVHKDTCEYGVGLFGRDPHYGKEMMAWIGSHYLPIWQILDEPLLNAKFGIKVLKWNSPD